jgi:PPK2 family polyphosphate:nucleotide phosphotransferase
VPDRPHRVGDDFSIAGHDTSDTGELGSEREADAALAELRGRIGELQARFLAEEERAMLIVLQGIDGSGKDTVITNVISAFDPGGCRVFSFKQPSGEEAAHDFLWRFHPHTPARGMVHVFDRSYYEEVIAARVHGEVDEDTSAARLESINDFERLLAREGTVILKFFLHISKDAQAERVRERLEQREKQADFSAADVKEREHWDDYDRAYEDAVRATSTDWAPWFAIPADHRHYARVAIASVLRDTLEALDPQFPPLDEEELEEAGLKPR